MTSDTARRLLDLTVEYAQSVAARDGRWGELPGTPTGRDPQEIADEYGKVTADGE